MEIASPDEVKAAANKPDTMILDVRTKEELAESSLSTRDFKHASCHLDDCSELMSKAEELFPDKNGTPASRRCLGLFCFFSVWTLTYYYPISFSALLFLSTATIIVFCRSGRRAAKAKEILQSKGYTHVLNAGGLSDLITYL